MSLSKRAGEGHVLDKTEDRREGSRGRKIFFGKIVSVVIWTGNAGGLQDIRVRTARNRPPCFEVLTASERQDPNGQMTSIRQKITKIAPEALDYCGKPNKLGTYSP
jgi:hypothetical protein